MTVWPNGTKTRPHISSPFGPRTTSTPGASSNHRGTDFTGFTEVKAVEAGTVTHVGTPSNWAGGGVQVWVQHDGFFARYLHLRAGSPTVKVGDRVTEGQTLGIMGMTGVASGVHLHLEITSGQVHTSNVGQVNPVPFITNRLASGAGSGGSKPKKAPLRTPLKWRWTGIQRMLKADFGYRGKIDNDPGSGTISAFQRFMNANKPWYTPGLKVTGKWNAPTLRAMQRWLKRRWGYTGKIDTDPGPGTRAAWERAEAANGRAYSGVR